MSKIIRENIDKFRNWNFSLIKEGNNDNILHINNFTLDTMAPGGSKVGSYNVSDIDEDLKYIATFVKGKSKKLDDFRILMEGVKSGEKHFIFLKDDFGGPYIENIPLDHFTEISDKHFKFKVYNYYYFRNNPNDLTYFLKKWVENNGKLSRHSSFRLNGIENYEFLYDFNGEKF